jgi:hypothetical protein
MPTPAQIAERAGAPIGTYLPRPRERSATIVERAKAGAYGARVGST